MVITAGGIPLRDLKVDEPVHYLISDGEQSAIRGVDVQPDAIPAF
jgi:hypothetical protein